MLELQEDRSIWFFPPAMGSFADMQLMWILLSTFHTPSCPTSPPSPTLCWQKGPWQRLPRGLSNAQLSFIQLSSELNSPKNGEVQVILGSQAIFWQSRIIAPVFDAGERLCRLAVFLTAQGISKLKAINVSWWLIQFPPSVKNISFSGLKIWVKAKVQLFLVLKQYVRIFLKCGNWCRFFFSAVAEIDPHSFWVIMNKCFIHWFSNLTFLKHHVQCHSLGLGPLLAWSSLEITSGKAWPPFLSMLFSWVGDELAHPLPRTNFRPWFSLKSLLLCLLHRSLWQWQQQSPWQGDRGVTSLGGLGCGGDSVCRERVLSHCFYKFLGQLENQNDGASNIDRIVMMALVIVQLLTKGMKLVENLTLFWHFSLPKMLCRVITVPTVKAWTLELLFVYCRCQLNIPIIAFLKLYKELWPNVSVNLNCSELKSNILFYSSFLEWLTSRASWCSRG